tara:strand:+ start:169 stop:471 length:303 start_codon:yes stop_codon:yes gene_type:complete
MNKKKCAYVLVDVKITNRDNYEKYKALAKPLVEKYGGQYLTRGGGMDVVLDELWSPIRMVLLKFPDMETARIWINSPDYEPIKKMRTDNSIGTMVILEGL